MNDKPVVSSALWRGVRFGLLIEATVIIAIVQLVRWVW